MKKLALFIFYFLLGLVAGIIISTFIIDHERRDQSQAFLKEAQECYEKHKYEDASSFAYKSIGANPASYNTYVWLGKIHEKEHRYDLALHDYEAAFILYQASPEKAPKEGFDFNMMRNKINELKKYKTINSK